MGARIYLTMGCNLDTAGSASGESSVVNPGKRNRGEANYAEPLRSRERAQKAAISIPA
jgi:hypothetical protein